MDKLEQIKSVDSCHDLLSFEDVQVISGHLAIDFGKIEIEHGKRYLLTAGDDGKPVIKEIPWDAAIASQSRFLQMLTEGNGAYVSDEALISFIEAAKAKLRSRGACQ